MTVKLVIFDVDDVLYDATLQKRNARENAVRAMIDAGLPVDYEVFLDKLREVIEEKGEDYGKHFDETLMRLGLKVDPRIIAAGVVAYHDTKRAYLKPFPNAFKSILLLREKGYRVGVCTAGQSIKDWEKIIRLGMHHLFHYAWVGQACEETFKKILKEVGIESSAAIFITANPILANEAKKAGWRVIRIRRGKWAMKEAERPDVEVQSIWEVEKAIENLSKE